MATNFRIRVDYKDINYYINVTRTSPGVLPNNYFATIIEPNDFLNKYPPITYTTENNQLLFVDNLNSLLPGFAELQKIEIMNYLEYNNIEL